MTKIRKTKADKFLDNLSKGDMLQFKRSCIDIVIRYEGILQNGYYKFTVIMSNNKDIEIGSGIILADHRSISYSYRYMFEVFTVKDFKNLDVNKSYLWRNIQHHYEYKKNYSWDQWSQLGSIVNLCKFLKEI